MDLGALAGEVANLMTPQAKAAGVEMHFEAPADAALIRGDADLLKQTLLNLVTNALEVMKNGGHLRLKVERTGDIVVAEVADDGPGHSAGGARQSFSVVLHDEGTGIRHRTGPYVPCRSVT